MPLQSSSCTPIGEQTCSTLWRIAQHLLAKAYEAISTCFISGCDELISAYVTTGQGDDGNPDQLTVSLVQIDPSDLTTSIGAGLYRAVFAVRLHESGWPVVKVESTVITPPPAEEQAMAIQQLMAHGEALHRRLTHLRAAGKIAPPDLQQLRAQVGQLQPVFPSGGVAGWLILVTIDMPWGM